MISLTFLSLFLSGCKFKVSPYAANTPELNRNEVALARIKQQESQTTPDFKVAVLSDTHNYFTNLDQAISEINENGPYAFVIIAGDVTNYGLLEEYEESLRYLNRLKYPYLVAVGNHDLLSSGYDIFDKMFGKTDFSFTYHDVLFLIFNNNNWEARGRVPDNNWIESVLSSNTSAYRVLIGHVSPDDSARFTEAEINTWEQILQNYQVDYILHGHNHNPAEGVMGGATKITIGSPSKKVYLELNFSGGGVTHQKISF